MPPSLSDVPVAPPAPPLRSSGVLASGPARDRLLSRRGAGEVDLVVAAFYTRGTTAAQVAGTRRWLAARAAQPGYLLSYPLRRLRPTKLP